MTSKNKLIKYNFSLFFVKLTATQGKKSSKFILHKIEPPVYLLKILISIFLTTISFFLYCRMQVNHRIYKNYLDHCFKHSIITTNKKNSLKFDYFVTARLPLVRAAPHALRGASHYFKNR